jgi:hypothetical protein
MNPVVPCTCLLTFRFIFLSSLSISLYFLTPFSPSSSFPSFLFPCTTSQAFQSFIFLSFLSVSLYILSSLSAVHLSFPPLLLPCTTSLAFRSFIFLSLFPFPCTTSLAFQSFIFLSFFPFLCSTSLAFQFFIFLSLFMRCGSGPETFCMSVQIPQNVPHFACSI